MSDDINLTPETAANLINRIDAMMPGILATEERDARRAAEAQRRRLGLEITPDDTAAYMLGAMDSLLARIRAYQNGERGKIVSEAALLAYIERAAMYVTRDYAREASDKVTRIWDLWDAIHTHVYELRKGAFPPSSTAAVFLSIERIAMTAQAERRKP